MTEIVLDNPEVSSDKSGNLIEYPPIFTRVKATVIDNLVVLLLIVFTSSIIGTYETFPVWIKIAIFVAIISYEPVLASVGATLGQLIMGIRVRDIYNNNRRINLGLSFIRFVVKGLLGWLSFLAISFTGKKRAIHDMAGMSIMVYSDVKGSTK